MDLKAKFAATVNYDGDISKAPKFKSKKVGFTLVADDEKDKGEAVVGKVEFDLATVAQPGKFEANQDVALVGKDKKETSRTPRLFMKIKAEWLKMDGKKLVATEEGSSTKKKGEGDDILSDLGDLGQEVSAFAKKKKDKKKGKLSEQDMLEGSEGGGKKVEINGVEHDLVDTDDVSEIEDSYNPENTDRDFLTDSDDGEEDPFEAEERKEREEQKRLERRASRRAASAAKLAAVDDAEGSESSGKKKKDKDKSKNGDLEESEGSSSKSRDKRHSRKISSTDDADKKKAEEEAQKKKDEEERAATKKKKEDQEQEEKDKKRKDEEEKEKAKRTLPTRPTAAFLSSHLFICRGKEEKRRGS